MYVVRRTSLPIPRCPDLRYSCFKMGPQNEESFGDADEKQHDESSEEEALSLCDLPSRSAFQEFAVPDVDESLRPQQRADFFEFFTSNSDMCPADDIIVSGKLLPLKDQCCLPQQLDESPIDRVHCRRSESLSELKSTAHSNSIKARAVRTSRSLDDRRHRRSHSSFVPELDRNCSDKSDKSSASSSSKAPKSRWQLLISGIGMVKFPPAMELRDIKDRQSRRNNPAVLFPGSEAKSPAASGSNGSSWGLLIKALSCKDHTSISVTTSFVCLPNI